MGQASETQSRALRDKKIHFPHKERIEQRGHSMKPIEFIRCPLRFDIMGIIFRCDLQDGHSGQCISLPDEPRKIATVMWPKGEGF